MKKFLPKRLLCIPFGIAAYIVTLYAQNNPDWAEYIYSRSVYPVLSNAVGFLPSLIRISLTEWLVVLFLLFCLGYIAYYLYKIVTHPSGSHSAAKRYGRKMGSKDVGTAGTDTTAGTTHVDTTKNIGALQEGRGIIAYRGAIGLVAIFCLVYCAFTALCGLNYYRHTFTSYTGYSIEQASTDELETLCVSLAEDMDQARVELGEDVDLLIPEPGYFDYYAQQSVSAVQTLAQQYPVLERTLYSAPKPVVMSALMSNAGIAGVFFPFTLESNINANAPFFTVPSTMAHELAHQCGFMREDEANFIAYLACKQSEDPLMRYSGLFLAFNYSISALGKDSPELAAEIQANLSQAVQRDREQQKQFWTQNEGAVSDVAQTVNDTYLKANSQTDGVSSYGRMVDLLLAEQRVAVSP